MEKAPNLQPLELPDYHRAPTRKALLSEKKAMPGITRHLTGLQIRRKPQGTDWLRVSTVECMIRFEFIDQIAPEDKPQTLECFFAQQRGNLNKLITKSLFICLDISS